MGKSVGQIAALAKALRDIGAAEDTQRRMVDRTRAETLRQAADKAQAGAVEAGLTAERAAQILAAAMTNPSSGSTTESGTGSSRAPQPRDSRGRFISAGGG